MREVDVAEGRREVTLRYRLNPNEDWSTINLNAADDYENAKINKVTPEQGVWPPPDQQLVLERTALSVMGVEIGDAITVKTVDGKEKSMEIVGTAHSQSGPPASLTGQPEGFISRDTLEWLGESRDFSRVYFTVAENSDDIAHIEDVAELVIKKIEKAGLTTDSSDFSTDISTPGEHPINDVLVPLLLMLTMLGGLALVLSGFLVVNVISAMLTHQTRQIGIMKSVGARQSQLMVLYFFMVVSYGVLALAVGLPLGAMGAWGFSSLMASFFNIDLQGFNYPISVLTIQMAVGLLVPVLAAVYPIISGTRTTVHEAISDYGLGKGQFGTSFIDRVLQRVRGMSRPLMISLRNTFRRKTRLILTLTTLTLAGTTFITIFSVRDSMLSTLEETLALWNFDMQITFEKDNRIVEIDRIAAEIPGIEAVESWASGSAARVRPDGRESDAISVTASPVDTEMLNFQLLEGRWLQPGDTKALVVNTDLLSEEPDLKLGDPIVLNVNNRDTDWLIVGVVQGAMDGPTVYANYDYYSRLTHKVGKARTAQLITSYTEEELLDPLVIQSIEDTFNDVGMKVSEIRTSEEIRTFVSTVFNFLASFLLAMAVVLAVVGGLGLSGTMSINVLERVREIGVMRAVGASDWAVLKIVIVEGMIIGLLSWIAGAAIALPLSKIASDQLGLALLDRALNYTISLEGLLIWLVVACGVAALASFVPARNASQLTVREVLAYE
jgi:putative ABC transport system permease protein